MDGGDVAAVAPRPADRLVDRAEGRSPADHGEPAARLADADLLVRAGVGDAEDLVGADVGHRLVVGRVVVDMAGADILLDAADPVHQPRAAGPDPDALTLLVAPVGIERLAFRPRPLLEFD